MKIARTMVVAREVRSRRVASERVAPDEEVRGRSPKRDSLGAAPATSRRGCPAGSTCGRSRRRRQVVGRKDRVHALHRKRGARRGSRARVVAAHVSRLADETAVAEVSAPVVRLVEQPKQCGHGEPYLPIDVEILFVADARSRC